MQMSCCLTNTEVSIIISKSLFPCKVAFVNLLLSCLATILGTTSILTEEQVTTMSPTAAAVAKIIKPGMKLTEVLASASALFIFTEPFFSFNKHSPILCRYIQHMLRLKNSYNGRN